MVLAAAEAQHRRQARLAAAAGRQAKLAWEQVPVSALHVWQPALLAQKVGAMQYVAARNADTYVSAALDEQDVDTDAAGEVNAAAFANVAGDGRSLVTLLDEPRIQALTAIGNGAPAAAAWASAQSTLQLMAITAVQDAGRVASGVSITARPQVGGFVRQLVPPSCSRCAILAGRWYRWDAGFERHPRCDCIGIPAQENVARDLTTDPNEAVRAGQVTGLSIAERKAFDEGADLAQLVNVHREGAVFTAGGHQFTHEGATRRSHYRRTSEAGRAGIGRITPEQIYLEAGNDRSEAIRLLKRFGYLN